MCVCGGPIAAAAKVHKKKNKKRIKIFAKNGGHKGGVDDALKNTAAERLAKNERKNKLALTHREKYKQQQEGRPA